MKGPYIIQNTKGQICQLGYSLFNTNEEGKKHMLDEIEKLKQLLNFYT